MGAYIVFVASIIAIWILKTRGLEEAFLKVWLPFFLLFPFAFWVNIPGLPDPNFMQAAIMPIMFVLAKDQMAKGGFRFGKMEILIVVYFVIRIFNDYLGRGYSDAQNYAFYCITALLGPYLLGAYVINSRRMDIATSKMFVLIFLFMFPMFLYEAKFWVSPIYKIFSTFFPGAGSGLSIRYGLARTAGAFEHPILACIMIIAVYRLHRWLCWIGEWKAAQSGWLGKFQQWSKALPFSFSTKITIVLIVMALMTISRGPWIGGLAGAAIAMCGNLRNRKQMVILISVLLVFGGLTMKLALDAYITPKVGQVLSEEARTMLYRKEMVDFYFKFFLEKAWTGWGLTKVPKIQGMESIDNAFFLMALQHGVLAPIVFLTIIFYAIVTQVKGALKAGQIDAPIGFTFAGIYLMCLVSFFTVYMGSQTEPLIFLFLGWGEGIKNRVIEKFTATNSRLSEPVTKGDFQRVML